MHRRGTQNFVLADPDGDVTIVGGSEAFVVEPSADFTDVLLDFMRVHGILIICLSKVQGECEFHR